MNLPKSLLLLTALLFLLSSTAQTSADYKLVGIWNLKGISSHGIYTPSGKAVHESLVFNADYTYQSRKIRPVNDTLQATDESGKWSLTENAGMLRYYGSQNVSSYGSMPVFQGEDEVYFIDENYFAIRKQSSDSLSYIHYQREGLFSDIIADPWQLKQSRIAQPAPLPPLPALSSVCFLVNAANPAKRKKLYIEKDLFDISYNENFAQGDIVSKSTSLNYALINDFTDTSVTFRVGEESIGTRYRDGFFNEVVHRYYEVDKSLAMDRRTLNYNTLKHITHTSDLKQKGLTIGTIGISVSAITALIVAPLVSINYKNGDFNNTRYYTIAGIGLAGIGVSIPVLIICQPKMYLLTQKHQKKDKKHWYLERDNDVKN